MFDCIQEYKQLSYAEKKPLLVLNNKDFKVSNLITGIIFENKDHKTNTKGKIIVLSYGKTGNQIHQI